ncbi:MAG: indolepyruvate ferredoxin oxidoreductase, partial [Arenicella sp.]
HNTSTKVPEGSKAQAGIGCHFMASWMDRDTSGLIQMGGEGVNWVAKSLFLKNKKSHIFQNLGDGTYFHSGSLAIRQSVAAGSNITYKILYNDAVAMTGGQPIDGMLSVAQMATQLVAEGVKKVVLVSEDPEALVKRGGYPQGLEFFHRDEMDSVQRSLREIPGVTALIYEQGCAAEKRRKRKRKLYPDPAKRVFINELVCEGCGDCSTQSNCLSIVPNETEFGRKRMIDQSSCNKDYSCVKGFCPSFLTIEGGTLRKPEQRGINEELRALLEYLPLPEQPQIDRVFDLLVGGVGGTGVVTIGAIITMAAHLESKGASVLDFMGFAQKGGSVMSYVRLAASPLELNQVRIDAGSADAAIICDLVVGTDERALSVMREAQTRVAANTSILPTADFIHNRNIDFQAALRVKTLKDRCGDKMVNSFDASLVAERLLGDTVFSNMMLLGFAWQQGMVPISDGAIIRAIELNGVAVEQNLRAFSLGRAAQLNLELVYSSAEMLDAGPPKEETLEQLLQKRTEFLIEYQNLAYAKKYTDFVAMILSAGKSIEGGEQLARAVARNLFKLMAYKDEYEVARLHSSASIQKQIAATFEGDYSIKYHLAPPILNSGLDPEGRPKKTTFGSWMGLAFGVMQHFKFVRGTPMDLFGYTQERRMERELIARYQNELKVVVDGLHKDNLDVAIQIASFPDQIRGFGPVKEKSVKQADLELERLKQAFADA